MIEIMKPYKLERVPFATSVHWRYLHQDGKKTWKDITSMKGLQKVLQGYYLQAYETKHRRHCNRQKKAKQRPTSKVNRAGQTQHIATS